MYLSTIIFEKYYLTEELFRFNILDNYPQLLLFFFCHLVPSWQLIIIVGFLNFISFFNFCPYELFSNGTYYFVVFCVFIITLTLAIWFCIYTITTFSHDKLYSKSTYAFVIVGTFFSWGLLSILDLFYSFLNYYFVLDFFR